MTINTLSIGDWVINRCSQYCYLGVTLDACINTNSNFNIVFKKFSQKVYEFSKIRKSLDIKTSVLVYKQAVLPLTECGSYFIDPES